MRNRQEQIHSKGFDVVAGNQRLTYEGPDGPIRYGSIKVGTKTLDDAVLNLGALPKVHRHYGNKHFILKAIGERNLPLLRDISNYFYATNGIYQRVCDYFAFMYRYDWYTVPEIHDEKVKTEKVLTDFNKILDYLDNSHIKKICGDIALNVIKDGAYYGCIVQSTHGLVLQELPIAYCRSRFNVGDLPVIEFNMKFFDENFKDINYRLRVLKMFPKDIQKGYLLYKQGKLEPDTFIDGKWGVWYTLEPGTAVKFSFNNGDMPLFINAIPSLIDLDQAQDLDRRKTMQQLLKVLIQKLPLDKNGDLIFDVDEARDIHNNAVQMLQHAIGVDVLTTFADIQVEDISDNNTTTSKDDLEKIERTVYNAFGVPKSIFNTDSNLALEKSVLNDESSMRRLLLQFTVFFDRITQQLGGNKNKYHYRFYMLETTQYNYKEMSKLYKEQVQIGYSKMLPQIALGHSQSSIIHTAYFENEILKLSEIMIPPLMSSTMNAEAILGSKNQSSNTKTQNNSGSNSSASSSGEAGRPEKSDDQKSAKTIANKESM